MRADVDWRPTGFCTCLLEDLFFLGKLKGGITLCVCVCDLGHLSCGTGGPNSPLQAAHIASI